MHRPFRLAILVTVLFTFPAAARAELRFERPVADAGEVRGGKPLTHRFAFVNAGGDTVELLEVKPGCGCLKPRVTHMRIPPGQAGAIEVDVNTLGHLDGAHTWQMQLTYRSGTCVQELTLSLKAHIVNDVAVRPAALTLFTTGVVSQEVVLADRRSQPLRVTEVRASSPHLNAHVGEPYRDDKGRLVCKIKVEPAADCPEGRFEDAISIYTSDPEYRDLTVPVTIVKQSRQRLSALPREVNLTAAPGQPLPARIVQLRDPQDQPILIESVTADDPAVTCRWAPGPGNAATLRIQVDRARLHGDRLQSAVHVHTRTPQGESITIPVTCILP
jgi:uncharacterized protein DUF1573